MSNSDENVLDLGFCTKLVAKIGLALENFLVLVTPQRIVPSPSLLWIIFLARDLCSGGD